MSKTPTDREKQLATAALEKQRAGTSLSKQERRALDKVRSHAEELKRWEYYRSVPKGHVVTMLGRQRKVVDSWATRFGMPVLGRVVDLTELLNWLGTFLVDNSERLSHEHSPAMERYREERAIKERISRLVMEQSYLPRAEIHERIMRFAAIIRSAGETLQKQHGNEARAILDEALDDCDRELDALAPVDPTT